jgi:hypothetical protein
MIEDEPEKSVTYALNRYKSLRKLEARVGIEPTHKGFADLSLTAWVPRLGRAVLIVL